MIDASARAPGERMARRPRGSTPSGETPAARTTHAMARASAKDRRRARDRREPAIDARAKGGARAHARAFPRRRRRAREAARSRRGERGATARAAGQDHDGGEDRTGEARRQAAPVGEPAIDARAGASACAGLRVSPSTTRARSGKITPRRERGETNIPGPWREDHATAGAAGQDHDGGEDIHGKSSGFLKEPRRISLRALSNIVAISPQPSRLASRVSPSTTRAIACAGHRVSRGRRVARAARSRRGGRAPDGRAWRERLARITHPPRIDASPRSTPGRRVARERMRWPSRLAVDDAGARREDHAEARARGDEHSRPVAARSRRGERAPDGRAWRERLARITHPPRIDASP